jgi:hypothetical protein
MTSNNNTTIDTTSTAYHFLQAFDDDLIVLNQAFQSLLKIIPINTESRNSIKFIFNHMSTMRYHVFSNIQTLVNTFSGTVGCLHNQIFTLREKEKIQKTERMLALNNIQSNSNIIYLNVGGKKFQTTLNTICSIAKSMLSAMFSGNHGMTKGLF